MAAQPEVTVIIPIYRAARYLRAALESVCAQTFLASRAGALEALLVVDGECEDFAAQVPPAASSFLKVHRIAHAGVSAARNHGIGRAAGRYVAFLDADDVWLPDKLERQMGLLARHPQAGAAYTNSFWIDKTGKVLRRTQKEQYGRLPSGRIHADMLERDFIITSSLLVRKDVFDAVGAFDPQLEVCEDWELKIRIAERFPVLCVPEPLIYYRLHAGGSHYKCAKMLECGYKVFDAHVRKAALNGNADKLKANVALNLGGSWLYIDRPDEARKYLRESLRWDKGNRRLYLMVLMSFLPKWARDALLALRDRVAFLP